MMMIYGLFVFELRTLPYQQFQHTLHWRHVKNERVNRSARWQYVGTGETQLQLDGILYPEITGGDVSLAALNTQAYTGRPWPLISGAGQIFGLYVIDRVQMTHTEFDQYGKAKKIAFSINFQRCDEDIRERLQSSSVQELLSKVKNQKS